MASSNVARDLALVVAGAALAGAGLVAAASWRKATATPAAERTSPPACLVAPSRVVEIKDTLTIDEHCGNASNGDSTISIASVNVSKACTEATQIPQFDEYVLVQRGVMRVQVSSSPKQAKVAQSWLEAKAGQMLWLPKGYLYTYSFPGPCSYVPVCLPAFSPEISGRIS